MRSAAIATGGTGAPERLAVFAQVLSLCAVAWGALAFGGVYSWAYWPLAAGCFLSGTAGLWLGRQARVAAEDRTLRLALAALGAAIVIQLIPLPTATLSALNPKAIEVLRNLNPAFAAGMMPRHSLSVWPKDTFIALALYSSLALMLVGMVRVLSVTGTRRLVEALTAFAVVLALVGIIQKPLYSGAIYGFWELEIGRKPFGPFVNRNHFAGWMLMAVPLTLALMCAGIDRGMRGLRPGWRSKVLWFSSPEASQLIMLGVAALVMALSLMLTMSRSGIAAFLLSLVMIGWLITRALDSRSRRLTATTGLLLLLVVVVAWTGPETLVTRFVSGDWGEFSDRRGAWTDAWSVIRDFPLAGTGLNTYWAAALFYQRHELAYFFAQAHNDYFQLVAEGGVLLTLPAVACLVVFIRDIRRVRSEEPRGSVSWWLRSGAVISLLAIACQETVDFSLQIPGNAVMFVIVCAIALHRPLPGVLTSGEEPTGRRLRLVPNWSGQPVANQLGSPAGVQPALRSDLGGRGPLQGVRR